MEDAKKVGQALASVDIDYLFCSDLRRTYQTGTILAANHPTTIEHPTPNQAFREVFFGYFEGEDTATACMKIAPGCRSYNELVDKYSVEKTRDLTKAADPFHLAENDAEFWARLDKGFDMLRHLPDGSNAVVICHGAAIRSIASRYATDPAMAKEAPVNGGITKLALTPTTTDIVFYNQLTLPTTN